MPAITLARYSGWLSLYWHLRRELPRDRLRAIDALLERRPPARSGGDCRAIARGQPMVQRASWRTYDQFLKANRVDDGVKSYDEVVTLVLGIAADAEGRPRPGPPRTPAR